MYGAVPPLPLAVMEDMAVGLQNINIESLEAPDVYVVSNRDVAVVEWMSCADVISGMMMVMRKSIVFFIESLLCFFCCYKCRNFI